MAGDDLKGLSVRSATLVTAEWPKGPPADKWINKTWPFHKVECYSALNREEVQAPATTWVNPEDTGLSDMSQPQRDNTGWSHSRESPEESDHRDRKWMVGVGELGTGEMGSWCFLGAVWEDEQVLEVEGRDGCTTV